MKHAMHCFSVFTLALVIFVSWGCATRNTGMGNKEGAIETTSQIVDNMDYAGRTIDANISSAIRLKLAADGLVSASDIHVDTTHGKVTLNGKVDTQAGADRAMQLGRSVDGVRSVRSSLTVKPTKNK